MALTGASIWGPALFLAWAPVWLWATLAGIAGLVIGLLAGAACGELLCRSDAGARGRLGAQFLALASLFALMAMPLVVLWLVRFEM